MARFGPLVAVAIGGGMGSLGRWGALSLAGDDRAAVTIFVLNVVGSLLLGWLIGQRERLTEDRFALVGTGLAGGLTTFSTYAVDIADRLENGHLLTATTNGVGTPLLALMAAGVGYRASRAVGVWQISRARAGARRSA